MILVACPHCEKKIVGSDKFAGQYRECPSCGDLFVALPVDDDGSADLSQTVSRNSEIRLPPVRKPVEVPQRDQSSVEAVPRERDHPAKVVEQEVLAEAAAEVAEVEEVTVVAPLPEIQREAESADPEGSSRLPVWLQQTLQSKESRSYLISTVLHAVLLLILGAWILPRMPETKLPGLITVLPENMTETSLDIVEFYAAPEEVAIQPPKPVAPVEVAMAAAPQP